MLKNFNISDHPFRYSYSDFHFDKIRFTMAGIYAIGNL